MAIDTRYGSETDRLRLKGNSEARQQEFPFKRITCLEFYGSLIKGENIPIGSIKGVSKDKHVNEAEIYFPFFPSHFIMPIKKGEDVWTISDGETNWWISRISGSAYSEDPNYTWVDRDLLTPNNIKENAKTKLEKTNFVQGYNTRLSDTILLKHESFDYTSVVPFNQIKPIPRTQIEMGDLLLQGSNNGTIKLKNNGSIDITVGRALPVSVSNLDGYTETNKIPHLNGQQFDEVEGIDNYSTDSSRIVLTQTENIALQLYTEEYSSKTGIGFSTPQINIFSSLINNKARNLVINNVEDNHTSVTSTSIEIKAPEIILYNNHTNEVTDMPEAGLHAYIRWGYLKDYLTKLNELLVDMASQMEVNTTPGMGGPSPQIVAAGTALKVGIEELKMKFDSIPSTTIYGE